MMDLDSRFMVPEEGEEEAIEEEGGRATRVERLNSIALIALIAGYSL